MVRTFKRTEETRALKSPKFCVLPLTCKHTIFKLTNEILKASNDKTLAGSIFCDLEKAFDSVNHDILLSKLSYYGISGKAKLLLESYLQNIQSVTGGTDQTSGECSLGQTIPI